MKLCDCDSNLELKTDSSIYESSYLWLAKDRIIFLKEDITKDVSSKLSALLLYYDNVDQHEDITLYIHSNGGDSDALVNIYDIIHMISAPVKTVCLGKAYSAAAVLLAAGAKGKRYAYKSSQVMIHGIQFLFPILGEDQINSKNYYETVKNHNDAVMKMLANDTGRSLQQVKEDCKRDLYLDAKQALKYGIIDHII